MKIGNLVIVKGYEHKSFNPGTIVKIEDVPMDTYGAGRFQGKLKFYVQFSDTGRISTYTYNQLKLISK